MWSIRSPGNGKTKFDFLQGRVEFVSEHGNARNIPQGSIIKDKDHKGLVRNSLPLAFDIEPGGGLKADTPVIIRVTEHYDKRTALILQDLQSRLYQQGANTAALLRW